jgi:hypothetical protein
MKSHEKTIAEAEGMPMGTFRGGKHDKVKGIKHNTTVQGAAHAAHEAAKMGKAVGDGGSTPASVKSHYGQGGAPITMNPTAQKTAHMYNERSQAGNADPCAGSQDCSE